MSRATEQPSNIATVIVIPTYNEAENILELIEEIHRHVPAAHLLVVDDNSPDGTWRLAAEAAQRDERVHLLHRTTARGRGLAGIAGFQWALEQGADYVIEMDADFSHQPKYLPNLLSALESHDFVLGSRYIPGGADCDRGAARRWISTLANGYARLMLGVPVRDCTSGYRGYRAEVLRALHLERINTWGPAILSDILFRIGLKGFRMTETPITFIDRVRGESTLTFRILAEGLRNILRLRLQKRAILESMRD